MSNKKVDKIYVMYGYNLSDEDETGYFSDDLKITTELVLARRFPSKKRRKQKGFGSPQQWLDFINTDPKLNHGYKFHLVSVAY